MNTTEFMNAMRRTKPWPRVRLRATLLGLGLIGALAAWPFRDLISSRVLENGTLDNDAPPPELVEDMIDMSPRPCQALLSTWDSGKPTHRDVSIYEVRKIAAATNQLPAELESLVQAAAFDPNLSVREIAFRILRKCHDPSLGALAVAQLEDCDPEARLMGAEYLRWISAETGAPTAMRLLDDPDPRVVTTGLKLLGRWTHQDFGVRLTDMAAGVWDAKTGLKELRAGSQAKSKAGAKRAKAWWSEHRGQFASSAISPATPPSDRRQVAAPEFEASTLDGHAVRLSDFHGKTVLLHFWASPRPGCVSELEDFMTLQQEHGSELAVVGVSLDTVMDDDGDLGGEDDDAGPHDRAHHHPPPLEQVRQHVARLVKEHGFSFPVIVDDHFRLGGKFDATEPPVTVIIDARGFIRRQFSGRRRLPVLEAMVEEASQPSQAARK